MTEEEREAAIRRAHDIQIFLKTSGGRYLAAKWQARKNQHRKSLLTGKPSDFSTNQYFCDQGALYSGEYLSSLVRDTIRAGKEAMQDE